MYHVYNMSTCKKKATFFSLFPGIKAKKYASMVLNRPGKVVGAANFRGL